MLKIVRICLCKTWRFWSQLPWKFWRQRHQGDGSLDTDQKIGTVSDALVDEEGHFRYFIVDLGSGFLAKVLLPVGRSPVDYSADRVYAVGMTREQADNLPEFNEDLALDDYEERVRSLSHSGYWCFGYFYNWLCGTCGYSTLDASAPLDAAYSASMTGYGRSGTSTRRNSLSATAYNRDTYTYQQEPSLYNINEQDHQTLRLYQERLIANKQRIKTGK